MGCDSSVVAALLKEQVRGYRCNNELWEGPNGEMPESGCCTASDSEDARKVASKLTYIFVLTTLNLSKNVVDNFTQMYAQGLTLTHVECNRSVKFDHLSLKRKIKLYKVATGHYKIIKKMNLNYIKQIT